MCPEKELISAYYDKELNGRWADRVGEHLDSCDSCRAYHDSIKGLSLEVVSSAVPGEEQIKERILDNIERKKRAEVSRSFRKRKIEKPGYVLAGAAVLAIVFFAGVFTGFITGNEPVQTAEIIEEPPYNFNVQVLSNEDAKAYLMSNDSGIDLIISIPANGALTVSGEPRLIREADYKRGQ
jgi:hypothetical protein